MIVLDTHVLVFWVSDQKRISAKARLTIRKNLKEKTVYVSSISVWEIAMLVNKGRLVLTMDVETWLDKVESLPGIQFVPIDSTIARKSVMLPGALHSDPADRIIIATARQLGATLITSDQKIRSYEHVKTLW
ncbi:twitching motility protein PilT [Candidatus Gottesmanbacteria bacterium RIFCSPLOWO2_01_FULL_39_12b]|uniref:Twitching motility protein PilT n=1 Tax=Candidatus Gottesmanbacteria bacterium RIFCSPLOWO2_01_FULL_39_12b TaxID=1798388 RepID=A0A1F6ARM1_9BACT|nr:MAG: twitching motility protein PilT [Candidatus Gottesmanbacteria bacterium RIFCSPLOWO2_01_FULL_39_12b]